MKVRLYRKVSLCICSLEEGRQVKSRIKVERIHPYWSDIHQIGLMEGCDPRSRCRIFRLHNVVGGGPVQPREI